MDWEIGPLVAEPAIAPALTRLPTRHGLASVGPIAETQLADWAGAAPQRDADPPMDRENENGHGREGVSVMTRGQVARCASRSAGEPSRRPEPGGD